MSLVNDMLRDLEERRAAPAQRVRLEGLRPVDETGAARRERAAGIRRGLFWLSALVPAAGLLGLLWLRLDAPPPVVVAQPAAALLRAAAQPPAERTVQVLEVLPQHDSRGLVLQLLLERSLSYRRTEQSGAVTLRLAGVELAGEAQQGRLQRDGRSLSWRVEPKGTDVQVQLVGLGDGLEVRDRLEQAGDRWLLWIEVPLSAPVLEPETAVELGRLPPAEPAPPAEAPLPAWAKAPVPATKTPRASAAPAATAGTDRKKPAALAEPLAGPAEVKIAPYQADALTRARQALLDGDYPRAISALQALHQARGDDSQVQHWLARAYLAAGQPQQLLQWLPGLLEQRPHDHELRMLLARGQLQSGATRAAVATLTDNAPALLQQPGYHALLAASYQQTGQWQESAAAYRQLVELSPGQVTWQLGLAIALEQLARPQEAARHYRLARQGPGLDDSARRFANERAAALGDPR